ncbi:hypothetical protein SeMB42_g02129 [Synchytrium endobioticum]|uniref:FYVE-type domain-containing protein n=1 Tax=Synchytrium endobioticum TaxID=286115 RepID=A0A507DBS3_9FUNG|nr:hypothetical protein SeLEV6574_g01697 [Synchytrium endobioticum]TPX50796.1 hypothetical protein SeMB42_g02129 [Synchytrium endobioticum]
MLANNLQSPRPSSAISSGSSIHSLPDANTASPTKKPPSSKGTLRRELDEALHRISELERQQDTIKKINVTLTAELKTIRQQWKITQGLVATKDGQLWQLSRKIIGDQPISDITRVLEAAGIASASHKEGLIGRIEELAHNTCDDKIEKPHAATSPSPSDEHLKHLMQTLYADSSPAFASSEDAWTGIISDVKILKQQVSEQRCLAKNYQAQIEDLHTKTQSYEKLLENMAHEASVRTSQLDAEKNLVINEAMERAIASENERLRVQTLANDLIRKGEEEMARLSREKEELKSQSSKQAQLEAKLLHMSKMAHKTCPRLFGSQTLGRMVYGDLHKIYASNWTPDCQAKDCFDCGKCFNMFTRRHHCRKCGGVFCASHIKNTVPLSLSDLSYSPEHGLPTKVCVTCFQDIHDQNPLDLESVSTPNDDQGVAMNVDTE